MVFLVFLQAPCSKALGTVEVSVQGAARRASGRSVASGWFGRYHALDFQELWSTLTVTCYFWNRSGAGEWICGGLLSHG